MARGEGSSTAVPQAISLVHRYSHDLTEFTSGFLGPSGITNRDIQLLLTIDQAPGLQPSALAAQLKLSRPLVSQALHRFESEGLVRRSADAADHRSSRLATSASGRAKIRAYESALTTWFVEASPLVHELHDVLGRALTVDSTQQLAPLDAIRALAAAGRPYQADMRHHLLPFGRLTWSQRRILALIAGFGPRRPVQLASALSLTSGGASLVLDHLQELGLVERRSSQSGGDRKAVRVHLTTTGSQAVATLSEVFLRHSDHILWALAQTVHMGTSHSRDHSLTARRC
jgi:DNA-binding MarR family transcriptional regulator